MRRLVDVDELIKYFAEDLEGYDNREYILQMLDVKGRIERVEAIPIEWLKKFANERALNDGMDCYWHFWGTDLLQMIEQWEKENEGKAN